MVNDTSSILDLPRQIETVETIDADHIQMAKFADKEDSGYRAMVGVLRNFIRKDWPGNGTAQPQELPWPAAPTGLATTAPTGTAADVPTEPATAIPTGTAVEASTGMATAAVVGELHGSPRS